MMVDERPPAAILSKAKGEKHGRQAAPPSADLAVRTRRPRDLRVRHLVALRAQPERWGRGRAAPLDPRGRGRGV